MDWQFYKNFRFAFRGLKTVFSTEKTFSLHTIIAILVVAYSWYQGIEKIYWVVILMIIALVMALEIFNSAIERLVDMLAPRTHKFAKEVKDLLAAMVLLVSLFAAAIGFIVFLA